MRSSTSFVIQLADFFVEICGNNGDSSTCLQDLKRQFQYHEVNRDTPAHHRIVVCPLRQFKIPREAILNWTSACLGGAYQRLLHPAFFWPHKKEIPSYRGVGGMSCYKEKQQPEEYFVPEMAEWRIKHIAQEHVTYVYMDQYKDKYSVLPFLLHIVGSLYGRYLVYGSCVAIKGEALLFIGDSGVGKTSISMELIKQGADYIGDDLVLLYSNGEQVMVGSILRPMKCFMNGVYTRKQIVDAVSDMSRRPPLSVPLKAVYELQKYSRWKPGLHLEPMTKDVFFEKMLELTNKTYTHANGHLFVDTVSSLCISVPSYRLYADYHKITPSFFAEHDKG